MLTNLATDADMGRDLGNVMGGEKKFGGFLELAVGNEHHHFRDLALQGASLDTGRMRALDATARLFAGGGLVVRSGGFAEIGNPVGRRTDPRFHPIDFHPGVFCQPMGRMF